MRSDKYIAKDERKEKIRSYIDPVMREFARPVVLLDLMFDRRKTLEELKQCRTCIYTDQVHRDPPCDKCVNGSEYEPDINCKGCFGASFNDCENCDHR